MAGAYTRTHTHIHSVHTIKTHHQNISDSKKRKREMPFKNKIIPVVSIIWEILYTLVQRRLVHDLVTEAFFWTYLCKDVLVFDNVLVGCQEDVELATPQLGDQGAAHGRGALSGEGERHTHTHLTLQKHTIQTFMELRPVTNECTYMRYYTWMHYPPRKCSVKSPWSGHFSVS